MHTTRETPTMAAESPPRFQLTLGVLMLAIAVAAAVSLNLKIILVDQKQNVELILETILR